MWGKQGSEKGNRLRKWSCRGGKEEFAYQTTKYLWRSSWICLGLSWSAVLLNGNRYQPPVLSVQHPAHSSSGLLKKKKNSFFIAFFYLSGNPVILSKYQLPYIFCITVYHVKVCDLAALQSAELLTLSLLSQKCVKKSGHAPRWKSLYLFSYFSLFPTACCLSSLCQLIYIMTNELQRHAMDLKTPIIKYQWDERDRPHLCHVKFQLLILCNSLIYQWWAWIPILGGTVQETCIAFLSLPASKGQLTLAIICVSTGNN